MPIFWANITASTAATNNVFVNYYTNAASAASCYQTQYQGQAANYNPHSQARVTQRRALDGHSQEARDRAHELLLSHLSSKQRETLEKHKWFVVEGGKSGKRYRIRSSNDMVANIDELEGDQIIKRRLCAHANLARFPLADHLLAQKLMIEHAEDEFLSVANRHAA